MALKKHQRLCSVLWKAEVENVEDDEVQGYSSSQMFRLSHAQTINELLVQCGVLSKNEHSILRRLQQRNNHKTLCNANANHIYILPYVTSQSEAVRVTDYREHSQTLLSVREINLEACVPMDLK